MANDYQFKQRKDGVSAIRTGGPTGEIETKMIGAPSEQKAPRTNGRKGTGQIQSLLEAVGDVAEAAEEADLDPETDRAIKGLLKDITSKVRRTATNDTDR